MGKQKRSANTYQKINTIFLRDDKGVIMPEAPLVKPEFEYLRNVKWHAEEKIDGTNMRIEVKSRIEYQVDQIHNIEFEETNIPLGVHFKVRIAGKTDNAQIPKNLLKHMQEKYPDKKVLEALGLKKYIPVEEWADHKWNSEKDIPYMYTIYGEGYGEGIQSGGWYIKNGNEFIVFDVKVNNLYLNIGSRNEIAMKLGAPIVPFMGEFTIDEAIDFVKNGFRSQIAENPDAKMAEGLVLRTKVGLCDRMGERLILKVKHEDFVKYTNSKISELKNLKI